MDLAHILTGDEDPAQWWLTYVEQMASDFGREHDWPLDDDRQATHTQRRFVFCVANQFVGSLIDEDFGTQLSGHRFQAGGEIHHGTEHSDLHLIVGTNASRNGHAGGNSQTNSKIV